MKGKQKSQPESSLLTDLEAENLSKLLIETKILEERRRNPSIKAKLKPVSQKGSDYVKINRPEYKKIIAIEHTLEAGIPLKNFYAKNKDNDPTSYITDLQEIKALWNQGQRRFKAFLKDRFIVLDIDCKPGKIDGLESFYKSWPPEVLPLELKNIARGSFPCYVNTPSEGFHLYFFYEGEELKIKELVPGVEIKEWQITAPGSKKDNGEYVLHGEFDDAPQLYGFLLDYIDNIKADKKQKQDKKKRSQPRAMAERLIRLGRPRIPLDILANEAVDSYTGNHERQVSFAGKAFRCKYSAFETVAYAKSRTDIFGSDTDTENTILSVFRDNERRL